MRIPKASAAADDDGFLLRRADWLVFGSGLDDAAQQQGRQERKRTAAGEEGGEWSGGFPFWGPALENVQTDGSEMETRCSGR